MAARHRGTFWPTSFWGHVLRGDERLEPVVEYVLNNPVRSGLIARWVRLPVFRVDRRGTSPRPTAKIRLTPMARWRRAFPSSIDGLPRPARA